MLEKCFLKKCGPNISFTPKTGIGLLCYHVGTKKNPLVLSPDREYVKSILF